MNKKKLGKSKSKTRKKNNNEPKNKLIINKIKNKDKKTNRERRTEILSSSNITLHIKMNDPYENINLNNKKMNSKFIDYKPIVQSPVKTINFILISKKRDSMQSNGKKIRLLKNYKIERGIKLNKRIYSSKKIYNSNESLPFSTCSSNLKDYKKMEEKLITSQLNETSKIIKEEPEKEKPKVKHRSVLLIQSPNNKSKCGDDKRQIIRAKTLSRLDLNKNSISNFKRNKKSRKNSKNSKNKREITNNKKHNVNINRNLEKNYGCVQLQELKSE